MRFRLTPRDESFYDLLTTLANHLVVAANLLSELLGADVANRKAISKKLSDAEHDADESTHAIMRKINKTFVTPFDRDDIYGLASALDDCMDYMEEAGDLIVLYKIDFLPKKVSEQVEILQRCAEITAQSMPGLRSMENLRDFWVTVNSLENQGDKLHRKLLVQMFDQITDPIELMKLKEVVEVLEQAIDAFEMVANMVETIALKES